MKTYRCPECDCSMSESLCAVDVKSTDVKRFRCRCDPPLVHRFENGEWQFYSEGHITWNPQEEKDESNNS